MKETKISAVIERRLLTAMIVSKPFLAGCADRFDAALLPSRYAQTVAGWAKDFFQTYGDAPGKQLESVYHRWVESEKPQPEEQESVEAFLDSLSREYESAAELNVPFLLDEAGRYLTRRSVEKLTEDLAADLTTGRDEKGLLERITGFRTPNPGGPEGFDVLNDPAYVKRAYADAPEPLIEFKGPAGAFLSPKFRRDSLVGIQGPEKRGKTWWCLEFAIRALRSRRKVAFFEVGDLSEGQIAQRIGARLALRPTEACDEPIRLPVKISLADAPDTETTRKEARVEFQTLDALPPIDAHSHRQGMKKFKRVCGHNPTKEYWKCSVHPMSSINVRGIHSILEKWSLGGFIPDVIICDYADILAPENSKLDEQGRVDETWKELRKLSQVWHACVIAPTQANAQSYDANTQSMKHFSRDKRKYAHVTAMLGLNQTDREKENQVMRLNWIVVRGSNFNASRCLWVAQCLPLGMAFVKGVQ